MVELKRVTFGVTTLGAGQPDYAQPESLLTTENTLVVKYPETELSANRYDDYAEISVNTTEVEYIIGTNANARTDSWAPNVVARSESFYASDDILVRFNYADAVQHEIPAKLLKTFAKRVNKIYVRGKNGNATVKIWMEG